MLEKEDLCKMYPIGWQMTELLIGDLLTTNGCNHYLININNIINKNIIHMNLKNELYICRAGQILNLMSWKIQVLVLFYNSPYLLCTKWKSRRRNNSPSVTSKSSWRDGIEKPLSQFSDLYNMSSKDRKPKNNSCTLLISQKIKSKELK